MRYRYREQDAIVGLVILAIGMAFLIGHYIGHEQGADAGQRELTKRLCDTEGGKAILKSRCP